MFRTIVVAAVLALPVLTASIAFAQTAAEPTAVSPGDASTPGMALPYRSAFDGYQPFAEAKVLPWKQSNETVRAAGGWRAYAREALAPEAKAEPAPELKPTPMLDTDPHAGRGKP